MDTNKSNVSFLGIDSLSVVQEDIQIEDASDGSNKKYKRPIAHIAGGDWDLGWTDGRLNQSPHTYKQALLAAARLQVAEQVAKLEEQAEEQKSVLARHRESLTRRLPRLQFLRDSLNNLQTQRLSDIMNFSIPLGLSLVLIALLVWMADIPLCLMLVAGGFGIRLDDLYVNASGVRQSLTVNNLFLHPILVATHLWEPLVLAFGLAFSPMILKLFLEEFFFRDPSRDRLPRKRFYLYVFTTTVLLGTFIVLGVFRGHSLRSSQEEKSREIRKELQSLSQSAGGGFIDADATRPSSTSSGIEQPQDKLTIGAFILLSVMLSTCGALLFYSGWNRLSGAYKYHSLRIAAKIAEMRYAQDSKGAAQAENLLDRIQRELLPERRSPQYLSAHIDTRLKAYQHGYERGYAVPETLREGEGMYARCRGVLIRGIAAKTNYF